jgi:hypothetical protein
VFDSLRKTAPAGIRYASYRLDDGVSFIHIVGSAAHRAPRSTPPECTRLRPADV